MSRLRSRHVDASPAWSEFTGFTCADCLALITSLRLIIALGALAAAILPLAPDRSAAAVNAVVKRFSNGTTNNSVGIVDAREDAPQDGPEAIYAADDGNLYLLDQVNGRILRFDA